MNEHRAPTPSTPLVPPLWPPSEDTHVHVWLMFHDTLPALEPLPHSSILSEDEVLRQRRFATSELQYRFQCRREMLRHTLTLYRPDIKASEWIYTHNPQGKPQLLPAQSHDNLFFNLSHTDGLTVLAISAIEECGIDIENTAVSRPTSYLDIADRFFTELESTHIKQGSIVEQIQRFFDFWTLKEAYIKAVGKGLSVGLDRFQFVIDPVSPIAIDFPPPAIDVANGWAFYQQTIATDIRLAIALRTDSSETLSCEFSQYLTNNPI